MESTDYIKLLSRWAHIVPAIILVGGSIFMNLVLIPALGESDDAREIKNRVKRKWAKAIMISAGLIMISGFYNAFLAYKGDLHPLYTGAFVIKLVLVAVVFYLSSLLTGRSEEALKFQQHEVLWGKINMFAAIMVVLCAGLMKVAPRNVPAQTNTPGVTSPQTKSQPPLRLYLPTKKEH
ncbi:MAG: hypothetical protein CMJ76_06075 [Planctomycetaceae bacterium]|nr:hypothetical protein [Planctomycetaceae bacterium]